MIEEYSVINYCVQWLNGKEEENVAEPMLYLFQNSSYIVSTWQPFFFPWNALAVLISKSAAGFES